MKKNYSDGIDGDICDEEDGIVLYSNREDLAEQTEGLTI